MKYFTFCLLFVLIVSCQNEEEHYTVTVLDKDIINIEFLQNIPTEEKALLSWYLLAYGNECTDSTTSAKCKILDILDIKNECESEHIRFLIKWFKKDVLMSSKLQNCPCLPLNFAIQNTYKQIILNRSSDTISIEFEIWGINEIQERNWNIEQTDYFLIKETDLLKIGMPNKK